MGKIFEDQPRVALGHPVLRDTKASMPVGIYTRYVGPIESLLSIKKTSARLVFLYLVEAAGIEPASASDLPLVLHAYIIDSFNSW